jgi:hypothetical protein
MTQSKPDVGKVCGGLTNHAVSLALQLAALLHRGRLAQCGETALGDAARTDWRSGPPNRRADGSRNQRQSILHLPWKLNRSVIQFLRISTFHIYLKIVLKRTHDG